MRTVQVIVTAACLAGALWLVVLLVLNRTPGRLLLTVLLGVEALLVLHLALGIVKVTDAPAGVAVWEYIGYLVGALLVVPVGVIWSSGEKTRGGTGVLLVSLLVVPFMFLRLANIWAAGG